MNLLYSDFESGTAAAACSWCSVGETTDFFGFCRRGTDGGRDAEVSDSCASSELDVCNERTESPFKFSNGGDDLNEDTKIDEQSGHGRSSSPRFRQGGKDGLDKGSSERRTASDRREKDLGFPRRKVVAKHNFHRPFLESDSADGTGNGKTFERQNERRTGTITSENSPPRDRQSVEPTNRSAEPKPSEEADSSIRTVGDRIVPRRTASDSGRNSVGFPSKCLAMNGGVRDAGTTEYQFKDERMNAAMGLISLCSAHVQSSPKRTAGICDSRNDSSISDSKSTESSLPNSTTLPSNALETGISFWSSFLISFNFFFIILSETITFLLRWEVFDLLHVEYTFPQVSMESWRVGIYSGFSKFWGI